MAEIYRWSLLRYLQVCPVCELRRCYGYALNIPARARAAHFHRKLEASHG